MYVAACNLCCRFTNSEEALALAFEEILGYSVNITITENHIELGKTELVMYRWPVFRIFDMLHYLHADFIIMLL